MRKLTGSFALGAGAVLLVAATQPDAPSFCERLAPQMGMKEVTRPNDKERAWKSEQMGALKKRLIGGTVMFSFSVQPGSSGDIHADVARASSACQQVKKDMVCHPRAPDILIVSTGNSEGRAEVREGERPTVETRGTALYCRSS